MRRKVYCYVDESGQDTLGKLFIIGIILTAQEREKIIKQLERIEKQTKKNKTKWTKTKYQYKLAFIKRVLESNFSVKI